MAKRILLLLLSAASLAYYLWIGSNNAFSMSLLSVWPALSVLFLGLALLPKRVRLPRWLRWTLRVFLLPVLIAAGCILGGMTARGGEDFDCLVVLGAALNGREPSAALEARLETAADYLDAHPETDVIVSGGQGVSEVVSEAECMRDWLLRRGIDPGRIRMEDRSTDTAENLRYSLAMLPGEGLRVGIVTSNFHVFRSLGIARAEAGDRLTLRGLAAPFSPRLLPHFLLRELCAVGADTLRGRMCWFLCIPFKS